MDARLLLRPLVLHMPDGRLRRWAERAASALSESTGGERAIVHWGFLDAPAPPPDWPLDDGRWIITSTLPPSLWRLPPGFRPAAVISPFEEPDKAAAAVKAVAWGWELRPEERGDRGGGGRPEREATDYDRADESVLSRREITVLEELARGEPNKRIAARLGVSESTVRFHVRNRYRKLGAQNRADAVSRAFARGLLII